MSVCGVFFYCALQVREMNLTLMSKAGLLKFEGKLIEGTFILWQLFLQLLEVALLSIPFSWV